LITLLFSSAQYLLFMCLAYLSRQDVRRTATLLNFLNRRVNTDFAKTQTFCYLCLSKPLRKQLADSPYVDSFSSWHAEPLLCISPVTLGQRSQPDGEVLLRLQ